MSRRPPGSLSRLYRYAYTAWTGRVGEPVKDVVVGEVASHTRRNAIGKIRSEVRALTARYPRTVKMSPGQFWRMT